MNKSNSPATAGTQELYSALVAIKAWKNFS
jgi:hypothetical protein